MVGKTDGVLCPYWEKDLRYMVGDDRGCEEGGTGGKSAVGLLPVRTPHHIDQSNYLQPQVEPGNQRTGYRVLPLSSGLSV